ILILLAFCRPPPIVVRVRPRPLDRSCDRRFPLATGRLTPRPESIPKSDSGTGTSPHPCMFSNRPNANAPRFRWLLLMEQIHLLSAVQPAKAPAPLRVLLVGNREEDFFLIREMLERTRSTLATDLDHAHSLLEAKAMLQRQPYGLILFEHETGSAEAVHLLAGFLHAGVSLPF